MSEEPAVRLENNWFLEGAVATDKRHLMVIGAHAMDAECMAGAVAARYASQGHRVTMVHLTRGERGHPSKPPEVFAAQLEEEMKLAAQELGAGCIWLGFAAGALPGSDTLGKTIADLIRTERPDGIVTHWLGSWHPRHVATHQSVLKGVKLAADPAYDPGGSRPWRVGEVLFGENCEDLNGFNPGVYIDVSGYVDIWLAALKKYELFRLDAVGGGPRPHQGIPYQSYYEAMVRVRGLEAGCRAAQAFMACRRLADIFSPSPAFFF